MRIGTAFLVVLLASLRAGGAAAGELSFRRDVLPVLSKAGCNTGGCHGALAGKGEFRLSLDGYDPVTDHYNITRETRGRRVEFGDPARSLILVKPTAAVKHKGGRVLQPGSRDYNLLVEWIRQGAPGPKSDDPVLTHLEISPAQVLLNVGDRSQLKVLASYSDGKDKDVTAWVRFKSTDASVADVDEKTGEVSVVGHGEGAVTAWFSSRIVIARITSPYPNDIPEHVFAEAPRRNLIDDRVLDQLRQLKLKPSPPCSDREFVRRAFLDTIGVLPTPEEALAFLDDASPGKRDALIEALLARPEFVDYWAYRWSDIFLVSGKNLRPAAVKAYYGWLRERVANNDPWDEIVRQVITAKGSSVEDGATNFYALHQDPESMAENVSQAFMSLSINCAKCHNHPLEKWTNDQYYSFANLFSRVRAKGWGGDARNGDGVRTLFVEPRGDLIQPRTGKAQPPAPLDAAPIATAATGDRREVLADWLTSPENPYFTRSIANRVWAAYFGQGIVSPVDDLRVSNPASNEPLLAAISGYLIEHDYDLKALMRLILQSETYRRSSVALPENRTESRYFSRYYPRRLMAEVLYDAIADVTGVPSSFDQITLSDGSTTKTEFYEPGAHATQLFDSAVTSYFLDTFGRNEREITCECERSSKPSMVQVLHLSNGDTLNKNLAAEDGRVTAMLAMEAESIVDQAYLLCLSRHPSGAERAPLVALFSGADVDGKRALVEDLFWALMTSREFLFQH
jgi:hypothetical protein